MLLVLVAFAIVCFINDKTNDSNEETSDIITLLNMEINETILISTTWKPIILKKRPLVTKNSNFNNWKINANVVILVGIKFNEKRGHLK